MANRSLGTLTLDLVAKIGGFTQSMNQAAQVVDTRMKSIQDNIFSNLFCLFVVIHIVIFLFTFLFGDRYK